VRHIPAVVLERKRAEEIYNQLNSNRFDSRLLQMGERGAGKPPAARFLARASCLSRVQHKAPGIRYHESITRWKTEVVLRDSAATDAYQAR